MEIFDFENEYTEIRKYAQSYSIENIIENSIPDAYLNEIKRVLFILRDNCYLLIGIHHFYQISKDLNISGIDDAWSSIKDFIKRNFNNQHYLEYSLLELLIYIYNPIPDMIKIEKDIVKRIEGIEINEDGLISGKSSDYICKKEGVIYKDYYLLYNRYLPGVFVSHGFVSDLLDLSLELVSSIDYLGFSLNWNILLNKKYYMELITKAYIRGPIGLSEDILNNDSFPEDPSGTVTEHKRLEVDPFLEITCPLDRLEIMWSYRDHLKTVQMEELKPEPSDDRFINCKYLHSQWNKNISKIIHFDGAIRSYSKANYNVRFHTDLKKDNGKSDDYIKLFKINGQINLLRWCTLATKYYDPNELVPEYFGGYQ